VGRLGSLLYLGRQVSQVKRPAILTWQFAMYVTPPTHAVLQARRDDGREVHLQGKTTIASHVSPEPRT